MSSAPKARKLINRWKENDIMKIERKAASKQNHLSISYPKWKWKATAKEERNVINNEKSKASKKKNREAENDAVEAITASA